MTTTGVAAKWELDWPDGPDDVPSLRTVSCVSWPLEAAVIGTPLKGFACFVKGSRNTREYPQTKSRKRKSDRDETEVVVPRAAAFYCSTCPAELARSNKQFQGSFGSGTDPAPESAKYYAGANATEIREKAFDHTCSGACQKLQKSLGCELCLVAVRPLGQASGGKVVEMTYGDFYILFEQWQKMRLEKSGMVFQAVQGVSDQVASVDTKQDQLLDTQSKILDVLTGAILSIPAEGISSTPVASPVMEPHPLQTIAQPAQTVPRNVATAQASVPLLLVDPVQMLPTNSVDLESAVALTDIERALSLKPDQKKSFAERLLQIREATLRLENLVGPVISFRPHLKPLLLFIILHSPEPKVFIGDKYERKNYDDNLMLIAGCTPAIEHSKRSCMIPARKMGARVIQRCDGSTVVFLDLCTSVPLTKQSAECDEKLSKVLSIKQLQGGLTEVYNTIADRAQAQPDHIPMVVSTVKALTNTFCSGWSLEDTLTTLGKRTKKANEHNFNSGFRSGWQTELNKKDSPLILFPPVPTEVESTDGKSKIKVHTGCMKTVSKRNFRNSVGYFPDEIGDAISTQYMQLATSKTIATAF